MKHQPRPYLSPAFFIALTINCFFHPSHNLLAESEGDLAQAISRVVKAAPGQIGVSIIDLANGTEVFSHNAQLALKPASVQKLITSATALQVLGPEFKFKTEFRSSASGERSHSILPWVRSAIDTLYVRGDGDPNFTIEVLWLATRHLQRLGIRKIGRVVLDDSLFVDPPDRQGQRAYETRPNAISFNFNSLAIEVCPTEVGKPARVMVDPPELKATIKGEIKTAKNYASFAVDELSNRAENVSYKVSGGIGINAGCQVVYRSLNDPQAYLAQLLIAQLEKNGISVTSKSYQVAKAPENSELLFATQSKSLRQILDDLNHYSNNFIAQQLVYRLGFRGQNAEVDDLGDIGELTLDRGLARLARFVAGLNRHTVADDREQSEYRLVDGSGLSHDNRVSVQILARTLQWLARQADIFPEFIASLPSNGRSGTLHSRDFGLPGGMVRAKTGTINGVSSLAGYVTTSQGQRYAFSIIQNGINSKDQAVKVEDKIVHALYFSDHT